MTLLSLITYPLWMATGFISSARLAPKPVFSWWYANIALFAANALRYGNSFEQVATVFAVVMLLTFVFPRRYLVALFLAWAVTDAVAMVFKINTGCWDAYLLVVYVIRSLSASKEDV